MENYFEHYRASNPDNRFSNSVSYYGSLYNKIFLNVGYHQEHHLEPQTHWSDIRTVKEKYAKKMSDNDLFISTGPPLLGHFSKQKY
jgi:fatty acid desaturase